MAKVAYEGRPVKDVEEITEFVAVPTGNPQIH
jgi:hypothetical protein